jgi:hypothetical protein
LTEDIGRDQVPWWWWWWWWLLLSALCKSLVHFVMKIETYPYLTKIYNKRERERDQGWWLLLLGCAKFCRLVLLVNFFVSFCFVLFFHLTVVVTSYVESVSSVRNNASSANVLAYYIWFKTCVASARNDR